MLQKKFSRGNFELFGQHWFFHIPLTPHTEPLIMQDADEQRPRDQALMRMQNDDSLLVGFDVWWKGKKGPSKGFIAQPSPTWFYQNLQCKLSMCTRSFYQVILHVRRCGWYFDVDTSGPNFPMVDFLQALFEEMCREQTVLTTPDQIWEATFLTDATCNVYGIPKKASCHGVCHALIFDDNHTAMKEFAIRVKQRLEKRLDNIRFRVKDKKGNMVIPLDISVYSTYRCFRMYGNLKMTSDPEQRRPLIVAPYNRYAKMPDNELDIFLLSLISQPAEGRPNVALNKIKRQKTARSSTTTISTTTTTTTATVAATVASNSALELFLLRQVQEWGNSQASINQVKPARGDSQKLYVSFARATTTPTHSHESNNIFAIVDLFAVRVRWHCHHVNSEECKKPLILPLPMEIAFTLI